MVSRTKLKNRKEMEEYKKQVDSSVDKRINKKLAEQERQAKITAEEKAANDYVWSKKTNISRIRLNTITGYLMENQLLNSIKFPFQW